MTHYNNTGDDLGVISDAPAWWFLNANVPRILQYGNDRNGKPGHAGLMAVASLTLSRSLKWDK